jgi:hypothetical protein
LLVDFLEHEVGVAAELEAFQVPFDGVHRPVLHAGFVIEDLVALGGDDRDVAFGQMHHGTGVGDDRAGIRGHDVLAVPTPINSGAPRRAADGPGSLSEITARP